MSAPGLGWGGIVRIGLVQAAIGAIVVFATAILNRVMVVELRLAATIPGALVGLHYAVQALRPRWGHGSDGGRRTPWVLGGMAALALGATLAADATALAVHAREPGLVLAIAAFALIGLGVGAAGTALLTLLAEQVAEPRRPAAGSLVWMMMIVGFILTTAVAAKLLAPFSMARLTLLGSTIGLGGLAVSVVALAGLEGPAPVPVRTTRRMAFGDALQLVWADPAARRLTLFIFLAMLAYSAEDLILEPFAALAFGWSPARTAALASLQNGGVLAGMIAVAALGRWLTGGAPGALTRVTRAGCLVSAAGLAAVALAGVGGDAALLRPAALLLGLGNGVFSASAIALMMAGAGAGGSAGVRMGVFGAAQALAFGVGGIAGAATADVARIALGGAVPAYALVLAAQAALFVAAGAVMRGRGMETAAAPRLPCSPQPNRRHSMAEFDAIVVGGGPAGATAATRLADRGAHVLLLDRGGRIKPCGGAIPPRLIRDFAIPDHLLKARVRSARAVAPSGRAVTMAVADRDGSGYVGMVDRDGFDEWLRARAADHGAERRTGRFLRLEQQADGSVAILYEPRRGADPVRVTGRMLIGADGARSEVARQALPRQRTRHVFAYHEIVRSPEPGAAAFDPLQCDVIYRGALSPDFYAWVFPHGLTTSIGVGSARKGFGLRGSVERLRRETGLDACATVRGEGAPIPLRPLRCWDNGRNVLVVGDAAGVVAPASGEGIYYAMASATMAAEAIAQALATGDGRALSGARRSFMAEHGRVFRVLGALQAVWYRNDWLRERFVALCRDPDVQRLTWDAYMNKAMVKAQHKAHLRLFAANCANLIAARFRAPAGVPAPEHA